MAIGTAQPGRHRMKGEGWRRLPFNQASAGRQLALSESLLAQPSRPALYWYTAHRPALILGASQSPGVLDLAACRQAGLEIYKRTSGGATVWAGPDFLSLDVVLPPDSFLARADLTQAYEWLGQTWLDTLARLGLSTRLVEPAEAREAKLGLDAQPTEAALLRLVCFGTLSSYEVAIGSRKLVGLAQVRRRAGSLLQSGLPLRWQSTGFAGWFKLESDTQTRLTAALDRHATGLNHVLPQTPPVATIITAFETSLSDRYQVELTDDAWTESELTLADQLQAAKYNDLTYTNA